LTSTFEPHLVPIVGHPPEAHLVGVVNPTPTPRSGDGATSGIAPLPPEDLLPPGGFLAPAPPPAPTVAVTPQRALALDALRVVRGLRDASRWPEEWRSARSASQTELIRRHLQPLRTRRMLAASFGREAFHVAVAPGDPVSPIRVAYALRWLELGDGVQRGSWSELVAKG